MGSGIGFGRASRAARALTAVIVAASCLLAGCAATVKRPSSEAGSVRLSPAAASKLVLNMSGPPASVNSTDWAGFKQEWRESFADEAKEANMAFVFQEGPARPTGEPGTLLSVYVEDYRFLRPGTRYAVGIMSGNAYIESKLTFIDLATGAVLGVQTANTSSSAWEGVFSAMTDRQVRAIAADVFKQVRSGEVGR